MAIRFPQATRQASCDAVVDLCEGGGTGSLVFYSGAEPSADVAATGTLLGTLTLSNPAFGATAADGTATANAITDDSAADATDTAGYFRVLAGSGALVFQGSVGLQGSGADCELTSHPVVGEPISVSSLTLQCPELQS